MLIIQTISATNDKNLQLANSLNRLLADVIKKEDAESLSDVISLESLSLPLFSMEAKPDDLILDDFVTKLSKARGFIFCAPEYNGGVPPVLSNALTWVSVRTKDWREAFNGKFAVIATHSGGDGYRFLTAFRSQLEYLGVNVYSRNITVSNSSPLDKDRAKKIISTFCKITNSLQAQ